MIRTLAWYHRYFRDPPYRLYLRIMLTVKETLGYTVSLSSIERIRLENQLEERLS